VGCSRGRSTQRGVGAMTECGTRAHVSEGGTSEAAAGRTVDGWPMTECRTIKAGR
jgi:hypothetical protein